MNFKMGIRQQNKLLVKHDENKIIQNLASRVRRVKSTVIQENKFYEEILKKRKKKEQNFINIPSRLNTDLHEEGNLSMEKYIEERIGVTEPSEQIISVNYSHLPDKSNRTSARESPNHFLLRPTKIKTNDVLPNFERPFSPSRRYSQRAKSTHRGTSANASHNENENLKSALVSKNIELESLRSELKDWWHEDFKAKKEVQTQKMPLREITTALRPISDFNNCDPYLKIGPRAQTTNTGAKAETHRVSSAPRKSALTTIEENKKLLPPKPVIRSNLKDIEPVPLLSKKMGVKRYSTPQNPVAERPEGSYAAPLSHRGRALKFKMSNNVELVNKKNFRYEHSNDLEEDIEVIVEKEEMTSPDFKKKFSMVNFEDPEESFNKTARASNSNGNPFVKTVTESPEREMTSKIMLRQSRVIR